MGVCKRGRGRSSRVASQERCAESVYDSCLAASAFFMTAQATHDTTCLIRGTV